MSQSSILSPESNTPGAASRELLNQFGRNPLTGLYQLEKSNTPLRATPLLEQVQSLFDALRDKDSSTAAHSLRTTMGCAIWAERLRLSPDEREAIETAALLHDIGKLTAPNRILRKPGPLTASERTLLDGCRRSGIELVREQIDLPSVSEIISFSQTWYDGSRNAGGLRREDIPFGARMLAIVDALDAMTTSQVYRSALSLHDALAELERCSGKQFDPTLVRHLCQLPESDLQFLEQAWQRETNLTERGALILPEAAAVESETESFPYELFHEQLLENLREAVVFVDRRLRVVLWSRGAERLTGLDAQATCGIEWAPRLLDLRDGRGGRLSNEECPAQSVLARGRLWVRRLLVRGALGEHVAVDLRAVPVASADGKRQGALLLLHDLTPEVSLRERCANLQQMIARDPLTQVANRAEFDRAHQQAVANAAAQGAAYSLILCDIDHFKSINDTFGHQAGDDVLKAFSSLVSRLSRREDLVARYGGEEFAIVCRGCSLDDAVRRAEAIRCEVAEQEHEALGERPVTASFGVASFEMGDTPEKIIARADKALYRAKSEGRNRVIAVGLEAPVCAPPLGTSDRLLAQTLYSEAPRLIVLEKLRGFISETGATIESGEQSTVRLRVDVAACSLRRRELDRRFDLWLDLRVEPLGATKRPGAPSNAQTRLRVMISTVRDRDRRRANALESARRVMSCLRSHLMAVEAGA